MMWVYVALLVFLVLVLGVCSLFLAELWRITFRHGIPSIASTWAIVDRIIVERVLPRDGLILDLGCGTGWTLRRLWRSGLRGPFIGYENAFVPWLFGRVWNFVTISPIKVRRADLFTA
ncbi:MAG: class I SAM-dependent methyltransferase, partial [Patescibacteria group bacterium]